jgi:hypothetical protein
VTYTVSDGHGGTDTATVSITVTRDFPSYEGMTAGGAPSTESATSSSSEGVEEEQ